MQGKFFFAFHWLVNVLHVHSHTFGIAVTTVTQFFGAGLALSGIYGCSRASACIGHFQSFPEGG
jgi:hypothetical protein